MENPNHIWQVEVNGRIVEVELDTLKNWIREQRVSPFNKVRRGSLRWLEIKTIPALMECFPNDSDTYNHFHAEARHSTVDHRHVSDRANNRNSPAVSKYSGWKSWAIVVTVGMSLFVSFLAGQFWTNRKSEERKHTINEINSGAPVAASDTVVALERQYKANEDKINLIQQKLSRPIPYARSVNITELCSEDVWLRPPEVVGIPRTEGEKRLAQMQPVYRGRQLNSECAADYQKQVNTYTQPIKNNLESGLKELSAQRESLKEAVETQKAAEEIAQKNRIRDEDKTNFWLAFSTCLLLINLPAMIFIKLK